MEAWSIIEDAYVDAQFGGHQWEDELSNALVATYAAEDGAGAYKQIGNMLSKLGDPFTRIVPASCVSLLFSAIADPDTVGTSTLLFMTLHCISSCSSRLAAGRTYGHNKAGS